MVTKKQCDYLTLTPPESFGTWPCIFLLPCIVLAKDATNDKNDQVQLLLLLFRIYFLICKVTEVIIDLLVVIIGRAVL